MRFHEISGHLHGELTLGTAQLGMRYGVVNDSGQPSGTEAIAIVQEALSSGVSGFDTARDYGESEGLLGRALGEGAHARVITKLSLNGLTECSERNQVRSRVDESVEASCTALRRKRLDVLLLHRWEHRHRWHGAAWERLLELRESGKIQRLGASVYEPEEALEALVDPSIAYLQIPVNVLDWRWRSAAVDRAVIARPDVAVHARSALLQGILAHPAERWPVADFDRLRCAEKLSFFASEFGRQSVVDLCFAYVRSLPWITSVVVGCETIGQLRENLKLFAQPLLSDEQCRELEGELPQVPQDFLNPSKWDTARIVAYAS